MSEFETLTIKCKDGYPLTARFYAANAASRKALPILICPATGITAQFYHSFISNPGNINTYYNLKIFTSIK